MNPAVEVGAGVARAEPLILVAQAGMLVLLKAEFFQHVAALRNYLLVIDPDVATTR
jgi:hypothetical protein